MHLPRRSFLAAGLSVFSFAQGAPAKAEGDELALDVGGAKRRAILGAGPSPGRRPRPVVLVLHGGAGSAAAMRSRAGFERLAAAEGFLAVYPEGQEFQPGRFAWNTGHLLRRQVRDSDDIAFLDALIDRLVAGYGADPARIFMTGGSNGGMMTHVYAVRRAGRLAAAAPVAGALFPGEPVPQAPLPILMINGALDDEVPLEGGMSRNPLVSRAQSDPYLSHEAALAFWVRANHSLSPPEVRKQGTVTTRVFAAGPGGAETVSVVDAAGGHGWPGTSPRREGATPIQAFDGATRVWEFFRGRSRMAG